MSRSLNTGDALYGNLLYLVGVEDDNSTVKEFKNATTLTKETGVTVQSGNYGYDFNTKQNGSFNGFGIDLTGLPGGGMAINASNTHPVSIFVVYNALNAVGGTADTMGGTGGDVPNIRFSGTNTRQITGTLSINDQDFQATNQLAAATPASVCYTFNYGSSTGRNLYLNGSKILGPTSEGGFGSATGFYTKIGFWPGQGSIDANIFLVAFFNVELSASDVLRLHNSLAGGGAFALFSSNTLVAAAASEATSLSTAALSQTPRTVTFTAKDENGSLLTGLSGYSGAWFDTAPWDSSKPSPSDVFSSIATDGSGVGQVTITNSTKQSGETGYLLLSNSDGTTTQSPIPRGFICAATVD